MSSVPLVRVAAAATLVLMLLNNFQVPPTPLNVSKLLKLPPGKYIVLALVAVK